MLKETAVDNLIRPLVERQEAINQYIILQIAKKIREIGGVSPSDIYKLTRLLKTGSDARKINQELTRLAGLQVREIQRILRVVAADSYLDAKPLYDYMGLTYIPFEQNKQLQDVIRAISKVTQDTYTNLSNSTAFMIRKNGILTPSSISETYTNVIDQAIQSVQLGIVDYNSAMRNTLKTLIDKGLYTVYYPTGYRQNLYTAVRRNILDGVRAINQGVQDEIGRQVGADGKEITVHANSAPDHEPIQGHQFTLEQYNKLQTQQPFEDYKGNHFDAIKRPIGMWNCRHFTYSIILGVTKPNFTDEQLQEYIQNNNKGYTPPGGKHMTMYDCTQYQRNLELKVRKAKLGQIAALEAGDRLLAEQYQAKINQTMSEYKAFSKACGLSEKSSKMTISGYKRISISTRSSNT